jgi:hypothetical protein
MTKLLHNLRVVVVDRRQDDSYERQKVDGGFLSLWRNFTHFWQEPHENV